MNIKNLKVIYYDSDEIVKNDILWGLYELEIEADRSTIISNLVHLQPENIEKIRLEAKAYDLVITQNFNVNVAEACHEEHVPYMSWIYDSPQVALFREQALYPENYIFAFDKMQYNDLINRGVPHAFYQPLAANITYSSTIHISDEEIAKYSSDVSFIGKMYRVDSFQNFITNCPKEVADRIYSLAGSLSCNWGPDSSIFNSLPNDLLPILEASIKKSDLEIFTIDPQYLLEVFLLGPAVAQQDRVRMMKESAAYFNTALYTKADDYEFAKEQTGANVQPPVWEEEPYKVFFSSKINLNLTLRTIETGIPQRIFDIMSVGGFVLSNYQKEIEELFVPDKEIAVFQSKEEFVDKAKYYLTHEKERIQIGINGYKRVSAEYNYPVSLSKMISKI